MNNKESPRSVLQLPLLTRVDRLDRLVQYLEEKQSLSQRYSYPHTPQSFAEPHGGHEQLGTVTMQQKPLSAALHEATVEGTLTERVAMLENRVLQLTLDVEECGSTRFKYSPSLSARDPECILVISQKRCVDVAADVVHTPAASHQGKQVTLPVPINRQKAACCPICMIPQNNEIVEVESNQGQADTSATELYERRRRKRRPVIMHYRKWLGRLRLGF